MLWRARFVAAALLVAVAVHGILTTLDPDPAPTVPVVVAAHALTAGSRVGSADVTVRHVPVTVAPDEAPTTTADVVDRALAVDLTSGSPLVPGVLVDDDGRGPPGTVVAAVRLADEAAAAMLSPGLRVDVIAATAEGGDGTRVAAGALVLPAPPSPPDAAGGGLVGLGGSGSETAPPVLLAVTPDEALALAGASASSVLSAVVVP